MQYLVRTLSPPLNQYIERMWYCSDVPAHTHERVLPSGDVDLVINLAEDAFSIDDPASPGTMRTASGAIVRGPTTRSVVIDPRQRASVIGVHFRAGGALPFLGTSPSELVDANVPLHDLWGATGRDLREQLLGARSPSERFRLLEAALLQRLRRGRPRHPAARAALQAFRAGNDVRVGDVATMVGLSHRGFIDAFKTDVGLTPKLFVRLQRFHRAKERIAALREPPSWAAFAVACGYFDQSHLIREFTEFSGMSPTSYLRSRNDETMFDQFVHTWQAR